MTEEKKDIPEIKYKESTGGRPAYECTEELMDYICDEMAKGRSLISICTKDDNVPSRTVVNSWLRSNKAFSTRIAQAREDMADYYLDKQIEISESATALDWQVKKFQADQLKWVASKLLPRKYGDKQALEVSGKLSLGELVEQSFKHDKPKDTK